jgi:hypothetical protein
MESGSEERVKRMEEIRRGVKLTTDNLRRARGLQSLNQNEAFKSQALRESIWNPSLLISPPDEGPDGEVIDWKDRGTASHSDPGLTPPVSSSKKAHNC